MTESRVDKEWRQSGQRVENDEASSEGKRQAHATKSAFLLHGIYLNQDKAKIPNLIDGYLKFFKQIHARSGLNSER